MKIVPVICGSAFKNKGSNYWMKLDFLPSPVDIPQLLVDPANGKMWSVALPMLSHFPLLHSKYDGPFCWTADLFRVYSGTLKTGTPVLNVTKGTKDRWSSLKMHANKREEIEIVYAGDIAAAVGLKSATTGDNAGGREAAGLCWKPRKLLSWTGTSSQD